VSGLALRVALAAVVVVLLAACGGPQEESVPAAPSTPAAQVIRRHLDAVVRGDLNAYLAAVDDDARFDIGGRILSGREEVRGFAESDR
jgi:hypothetical protein